MGSHDAVGGGRAHAARRRQSPQLCQSQPAVSPGGARHVTFSSELPALTTKPRATATSKDLYIYVFIGLGAAHQNRLRRFETTPPFCFQQKLGT